MYTEARGRKGGREAEGARLESVFTLLGNKGSNPFPSASIKEVLALFLVLGSGSVSIC